MASINIENGADFPYYSLFDFGTDCVLLLHFTSCVNHRRGEYWIRAH